MLLKLYNENIIQVFNINKTIHNFYTYLFICKYINKLILNDYIRLTKQCITIVPILELWQFLAHNSKIMCNIKQKLYNNEVITYNYYKNINTNSLREFDISIGWGNNKFQDDLWINIFSFNNIAWTEEEHVFLSFNYGIQFNEFSNIDLTY
jgi:hypothetical protein